MTFILVFCVVNWELQREGERIEGERERERKIKIITCETFCERKVDDVIGTGVARKECKEDVSGKGTCKLRTEGWEITGRSLLGKENRMYRNTRLKEPAGLEKEGG